MVCVVMLFVTWSVLLTIIHAVFAMGIRVRFNLSGHGRVWGVQDRSHQNDDKHMLKLKYATNAIHVAFLA